MKSHFQHMKLMHSALAATTLMTAPIVVLGEMQFQAEGALGIVRRYLPAQKEAVQLDWVELTSSGGKPQRSDF